MTIKPQRTTTQGLLDDARERIRRLEAVRAGAGPSLFGANADAVLDLDSWPAGYSPLALEGFATNDGSTFSWDVGDPEYVRIHQDGFYLLSFVYYHGSSDPVTPGVIQVQLDVRDAANASLYTGIGFTEGLQALSSGVDTTTPPISPFRLSLTGQGYFNFSGLADAEYPLRVSLQLDTGTEDPAQSVLYGMHGIRYDQITDPDGFISNI